MKTVDQRRRLTQDDTVLCVVHTDRAIEFDRCNLNFLSKRYASPDRLSSPPPFESLRPSIEASPHLGAITLWTFRAADFCEPELVAYFRPGDYKPQQALWHDGLLWVVGVEKMHLYNHQFEHVQTIADPWMAGGHSIALTPANTMLTTWSASDSVIEIDAESHKVRSVWRFPESRFGTNYQLTRSDSVIDHYIHNDLQLTHVNHAWPYRDGCLVSTLIQGAIGYFDSAGEYSEIIRHYIGCHGVRTDHRGRIYFCDSCVGTINFISGEGASGELLDRYDMESCWLHDALELAPGIFVTALADRNTIEIVDIRLRETLARVDAAEFGEGVQFITMGGRLLGE